MTWWAWIIGGAILLGAELFFVDAQFYLVFLGSAAIGAGIALAAFPELAGWAQWTCFAVLALVSMVGFRRRVYARLRGQLPGVQTGPIGQVLELPQVLAPGEHCQVEHGGSFWTVRNDTSAPLAAGARVRVLAVDGVTLRVQALDQA